MISKKELAEYAKVTALNMGQAEKDYFQNILLFIIYQAYSTGAVFKGGTALKKCYGLSRFSEDLDFTFTEKFDAKDIEKGIERFKIDSRIQTKKYENGIKIILRIKGPLYTGVPQSLCNLVIDVSFRESVILPPVVKTIGRFLEEIPAFDVFVMEEKEIFTEKIRAVLSRSKARDVYDVWFLLNKGVEVDENILEEKFKYYKQSWNFKEFETRINSVSRIWESELRYQLKILPDFNEVKKLILSKAKKWKFKKRIR